MYDLFFPPYFDRHPFLSGMAMVLDATTSLHEPMSDEEAIASDWAAVGHDLSLAMESIDAKG